MPHREKVVTMDEESCPAVYSAPNAILVDSDAPDENSAPPTGGDTAAQKNSVILRSSDGQEFEVEVLQNAIIVDSEAPDENSAPPTRGDTAAQKNSVILRSSDGQEFEVEVLQAMGSETIKNIIEDGCAGTAVPLPNVTGDVLAIVLKYWHRHAQGDEGSEELKQWDQEFADIDDHDEMFDLIRAANYLAAKPLLDLLCQAVADTIEDFTVEQVREYFDIENDFTPEEEAKYREENKWVFD